MADEIKDCGRCGEDACLVSFDGKHMVRVRRWGKCKNYKPGRGELTCQSEVRQSAALAIDEWNETHGTPQPSPARRNEVPKYAGAAC